jgi:RNase P subunit RPR2
MRILISYIRQCFCKHELEFEEEIVIEKYYNESSRIKYVSQTCKKCGYHKSYPKY